MKLDRSTLARDAHAPARVGRVRIAQALVVLAGLTSLVFVTGCAGAPPAPKAASASQTATTNLMSAQLPGPAPRVGKAHLASDDEIEALSTNPSDENAPKEARRSDGSRRRAGSFGTTK